MKYTRKELGQYIKRQRKYFKLSQNQVAEITKVSRQCVGRIERGESSYPYVINVILRALCIDPRNITIVE